VGVIHAFSACIGCGRQFFYNPIRVPSIVINGEREPICADCVARANPTRIANGLPPIVPMAGAYDAVEETEMIWPDDD